MNHFSLDFLQQSIKGEFSMKKMKKLIRRYKIRVIIKVIISLSVSVSVAIIKYYFF